MKQFPPLFCMFIILQVILVLIISSVNYKWAGAGLLFALLSKQIFPIVYKSGLFIVVKSIHMTYFEKRWGMITKNMKMSGSCRVH